MVFAIVLTGIEAFLPFAKDLGWVEWMPGGVFALVSCFVVMAALFSRIVVQNNLRGDC